MDRSQQDGHRIVFWHGPAREFEEVLSTLALDGVTLLCLDELSALEAKVCLE